MKLTDLEFRELLMILQHNIHDVLYKLALAEAKTRGYSNVREAYENFQSNDKKILEQTYEMLYKWQMAGTQPRP